MRLVFLAGYPDYYLRHGFEPAYPHGFTPPFPVSPSEAWMVRPLGSEALGNTGGVVTCANAMDKAEHWQE
jgi:predicted N-acetyltransferase YhbS